MQTMLLDSENLCPKFHKNISSSVKVILKNQFFKKIILTLCISERNYISKFVYMTNSALFWTKNSWLKFLGWHLDHSVYWKIDHLIVWKYMLFQRSFVSIVIDTEVLISYPLYPTSYSSSHNETRGNLLIHETAFCWNLTNKLMYNQLGSEVT